MSLSQTGFPIKKLGTQTKKQPGLNKNPFNKPRPPKNLEHSNPCSKQFEWVDRQAEEGRQMLSTSASSSLATCDPSKDFDPRSFPTQGICSRVENNHHKLSIKLQSSKSMQIHPLVAHPFFVDPGAIDFYCILLHCSQSLLGCTFTTDS